MDVVEKSELDGFIGSWAKIPGKRRFGLWNIPAELDGFIGSWAKIPGKRRFGLWNIPAESIVVAVIVLTVATLLSRSILATREAARRSQCLCNMCMTTMGLHNYHQANECLPPAFGTDDAGKPRCSWRVSLLPYMEQGSLLNSYNFAVAWDAPENTTVSETKVSSLICPSREESYAKRHLTSYSVVQGPGTMFPGADLVKFSDIKDGLDQSLAIVEVANVDIAWTSPLDLDTRTMSFQVNDRRKGKAGLSSRHSGGLNVAFGDAHRIFLKDSVTTAQLKALLTIDGGEAIDAGVLP